MDRRHRREDIKKPFSATAHEKEEKTVEWGRMIIYRLFNDLSICMIYLASDEMKMNG
jgi:hypothetical protein